MDIALIGLTVSLLGFALGLSKYFHGKFEELKDKIDARLDDTCEKINAQQADRRVIEERTQGHLNRHDAWCDANQKAIEAIRRELQALQKMLETQNQVNRNLIESQAKALRSRLGDVELFMAKELSFQIRRNREE